MAGGFCISQSSSKFCPLTNHSMNYYQAASTHWDIQGNTQRIKPGPSSGEWTQRGILEKALDLESRG